MDEMTTGQMHGRVDNIYFALPNCPIILYLELKGMPAFHADRPLRLGGVGEDDEPESGCACLLCTARSRSLHLSSLETGIAGCEGLSRVLQQSAGVNNRHPESPPDDVVPVNLAALVPSVPS